MRILTLPPARVVQGFDDFVAGDLKMLDAAHDRSHPPILVDVMPVEYSPVGRFHSLESNWLQNLSIEGWAFFVLYKDGQICDCTMHKSGEIQAVGQGPVYREILRQAAEVMASEEGLYEYRILNGLPPWSLTLRMIGPRPRVIVYDHKGNYIHMSEEEYVKEMIQLDTERIARNAQYSDGSIGGKG